MQRSALLAFFGSGLLVLLGALMFMTRFGGWGVGYVVAIPGYLLARLLDPFQVRLGTAGLATTAFLFWFAVMFAGHRALAAPIRSRASR